MNHVLLHIDTSVSKEASVELRMGNEVFSKRQLDHESRSQALLLLIESLLAERHLDVSAISEITVVTGPGSFTGIRVGLTVANTLATLLSIPVNGKRTLATPTYS